MSKIKKAKKTTSIFKIAFINLMQLLFPKTIVDKGDKEGIPHTHPIP